MPKSRKTGSLDPVDAEWAAWEAEQSALDSEPGSTPEEIARHMVSWASPEARAFLATLPRMEK